MRHLTWEGTGYGDATENSEIEKECNLSNPPDGDNLGLANGMLLHNDHISNSNSNSNSKRSTLAAPTVLRYPRGG